MTEAAFTGVKAGLLHQSQVLSIQRDDFPGLRWAGYWDLPGGGREPAGVPPARNRGGADPAAAAGAVARRLVASFQHGAGAGGVFFLASLTAAEIAQVRLGDEGQRWQTMPIAGFLAHERAVPFLKDRLRHALTSEQG